MSVAMVISLAVGWLLGVLSLIAGRILVRQLLRDRLIRMFTGPNSALMAWRILSARQFELLINETMPALKGLVRRRDAADIVARIRAAHHAKILDFEAVDSLAAVADYMRRNGLADVLGANRDPMDAGEPGRTASHAGDSAADRDPPARYARDAALLQPVDPTRLLGEVGQPARYFPLIPPDAPVRLPAEFEPMRAVLVTWPVAYPSRWQAHAVLVAAISRHAEAHVLAPNEAWAAAAQPFLDAAGADWARTRFVMAPTDDIWIRDYGPSLVTTARGPALIANPYIPNGLGYHKRDHDAPVAIARAYGVPVHRLPLVIEGGNLISDGQGHLMLTDSVFGHNPEYDRDGVATIMQRFFGVERMTFLPALPGEMTGHIDIAVKLAGNDSLWVSQAPAKHPWHDTLEAMADILKSTPSATGAPYRVERLPLAPNEGEPSEKAYANSLTVNGALLVPSYDPETDRKAEAALVQLAPGKVIEWVDYRAFNIGALHCQTKEIAEVAGLPPTT